MQVKYPLLSPKICGSGCPEPFLFGENAKVDARQGLPYSSGSHREADPFSTLDPRLLVHGWWPKGGREAGGMAVRTQGEQSSERRGLTLCVCVLSGL